jgi:glycogen synthase
MNIALFSSDFYPSVGGVQEVVRQSAHALIRAGDKPMVFTNRWPKTLPANEMWEQIPVHRHVFRVPEPNFKQMGGALLVGPWTLRQVCRQLKEHATQLIHIHCASSNAHYAMAARRKLRLPMVLTVHGELSMDPSRLFQRSAFAQSNLRKAIDQADAITACSQQALAEAELFYGKPLGDRARVVYSGVRVEDFSVATPYIHPRPYLLSIGRLAPQKGFDVLLRACSEVFKHNSSHDLILAGDGPEHNALVKLAEKLQISSRVYFFGPAPRETTIRLFAGSEFVVTPSRQEAMGIVNLEAMAAGKAVIATRVGGVPEIVQDGKNGVLVSPESVFDLTGAIMTMLSDPARRAQLAKAGKQRAMEFDWSRINEQFRRIYSTLIPNRGDAAASEELPLEVSRAS